MTRADPSIVVKRLVIERANKPVYDELFHIGVNIIRGENSSGKSTILNFLFYGLGGDLTDWSEAAKLCTRVFVEVEFNGMPATLAREISVDHGQPMEIFGGSFIAAKAAAIGQWTRYRYARSSQIESFSLALFRLIGLPEVASEASGNLTMHQVLRLLYADQLSPVESIFKKEGFDPPNRRDAIGRLLCGAYESDVYNNELTIRALQKEVDGFASELKSLISVIGQAGQAINLEWAHEQQKALEMERAEVGRRTQEAEQGVYESATADQVTLNVQDKVYAQLQDAQSELAAARQERDALSLEIADSGAFIQSLERKLDSLRDADAIAEHIGSANFEHCPACYASLSSVDNAVSEGRCPLCKSRLDPKLVRERSVAIINDTALQRKQSATLQEGRIARQGALARLVDELTAAWKKLSVRFAEVRRLPSSEAREKLRELHRQVGYLDRKIEDQQEKSRLVVLFNEKHNKQMELKSEIERLEATNSLLRSAQEDQLQRAFAAISNEVRWLLHHDLRRQDVFETANVIEFDFAADRIGVDGESYFSASSRVILKSSFYIGFLAAAATHPFFRHPRFCIVDTIEDKGMEQARSHNFQRLIVKISGRVPFEHQIIFATAMIAPELGSPEFTVGQFSTRDSPTLAIGDVHVPRALDVTRPS